MDNQITTLSKSVTRQKITIAQTILTIIVAFLPFFKGMFEYREYEYSSLHTKTTESLSELISFSTIKEEFGTAPLLFYGFYILLAIMLLYCTVQIFRDSPIKRKSFIFISILMFISSAIMIFKLNSHEQTDYYHIYGYSTVRSVYLDALFPAYLHLLCIVIIVALEAYKQFKIKD